MQNTIIAVDIAKNVFEVAVSHRTGVVTERHRLSRRRFLPFFAELKPTTVLLEACGTAHHWARRLQALGHTPILLPAHDTRPYVLRNKTARYRPSHSYGTRCLCRQRPALLLGAPLRLLSGYYAA